MLLELVELRKYQLESFGSRYFKCCLLTLRQAEVGSDPRAGAVKVLYGGGRLE